jgi:hypothetical protein
VTDSTPDQPANPGADPRSRSRARTEAKNQAVRETLEPLAPGERPLAVTIASIAAALLALGNLLTYVFSDHAANANRGGEIFQTLAICVVLAIASWGMWRAKYWAVLGFQTILGLQIIILSLSLLRVSNALVALLFVAILLLSAVLFWFLVRAMARIQMPEAPDVKSLKEQRDIAAAAEAAEQEEIPDGKADDADG